MPSNLEFLEPGFDPKTLKVPQLRRILAENNVDIPSKVKKNALVRLYEKEIVPQLDDLRDRYKNVKPSSKGIKKVTKKKQEKLEPTPTSTTSSPSKPKKRSRKTVKEEEEQIKKEQKKNEVKFETIAANNEATDKKKVDDDEQEAQKKKKKRKNNKKKKNVTSDKKVENDSETAIPAPEIESAVKVEGEVEKRNSLTTPKPDQKQEGLTSTNKIDSILNIVEQPVKREILKPDLSKLKVSPEFAVLLKSASEQTNDSDHLSNKIQETVQEVEKVEEIEEVKEENDSSEVKNKEEIVEVKESNDIIPDSEGENEHQSSQLVNDDNTDSTETSELPKTKKEKTLQSIKPWGKREGNEISDVNTTEKSTADLKTPLPRTKKNLKIKQWVSRCGILKLPKTKCLLKVDCQVLRGCLFNITIFAVITLPILFGMWYREQRIRIGYCGTEQPLKSIIPSSLNSFSESKFNKSLSFIDKWLAKLKPDCLSCPDGAICFPEMGLACEPHFRKILPLFSFNKLLPISEYCIPDVRKKQFLDEMLNTFVKMLGKRNSKLQCGNAKNQLKNSIARSSLHEIFDYKGFKQWSENEVNDMWDITVEQLNKIPEISTFSLESENGNVITVYMHSSSNEFANVICKYGDQVKEFVKQNRLLVISSTVFTISTFLINSHINKCNEYKATVDAYVDVTLDKLKNETGVKGDNDVDFLHTLQLRDVVLSDVVDLNERKKIWKSMTETMKKNDHIVCTSTEINGEILECWSWKDAKDL